MKDFTFELFYHNPGSDAERVIENMKSGEPFFGLSDYPTLSVRTLWFSANLKFLVFRIPEGQTFDWVIPSLMEPLHFALKKSVPPELYDLGTRWTEYQSQNVWPGRHDISEAMYLPNHFFEGIMTVKQHRISRRGNISPESIDFEPNPRTSHQLTAEEIFYVLVY